MCNRRLPVSKWNSLIDTLQNTSLTWKCLGLFEHVKSKSHSKSNPKRMQPQPLIQTQPQPIRPVVAMSVTSLHRPNISNHVNLFDYKTLRR